MEHTKLANDNKQESRIARAAPPAEQQQMNTPRRAGKNSVREKTAPTKARTKRPLRKELDGKLKSNRLVCRYCGSDDLAPSFMKRRDRRCRKCFTKRYGSAVRASKAKVKK